LKSEEWIAHVTELRKRCIIVVAWFIITFCAGLYAAPYLLHILKNQPSAAHIVWNVFAFTDGLFIFMKCAFLFAVTFTLPIVLYHLWAFVKPGLTDIEAKSILAYLPASFALFLIGLSFSYWVVFPMMISFMTRMNAQIGAVETYGIDRYFSFLFDIVIPLSLAFELPVLLLFLTRVGLVTPERLRRSRKYAYVGLAIAGSCLSPPDFVSHLSVTIPLILLYECSVIVCGRVARKHAKLRPGSDPTPT